jgi:hypothetical protein
MSINQTENGNSNQGEGDQEADRHYREKTQDFVKEGRVDDAAEKAKHQDKAEGEKAEKAGKSRAKELDPETKREYDKPVEGKNDDKE